ncbi:MAG: hypothetical protein M2R46_01503 [Verrucomicrobia subdivision 3 bacterium]|nr:hypothetical protein [Limisphaerales bacterium]
MNAFEFFKRFPDEKAARKFIEEERWKHGVECPKCHAQKQAAERRPRPGVWRCRRCRKDFTVRIGSVFERGHVSLQTWPCAVYLLNMGRKRVSLHGSFPGSWE